MNKFKRIMAIVMVIVLIGIFVTTFILGIMGSKYFTGMLFLCVIVPVLCYAISLTTKLLRKKGEELEKENNI
ncbi:MAG: hypothetical protein ACI4EF_08765 [Coprococcus sp.]